MTAYDYVRDGDEIYRRSFAIIRSEAKLERFRGVEERVAVRVIHACGMPDVATDLVFAEGAADAGAEALKAGAPILCDSQMVAHGVTRSRLPADNEVLCLLGDPRVAELAKAGGLTRSAAAIDLMARSAGRRCRGDRQRAHSPVSSPRDPRRGRGRARLRHRDAGRLRRRRRIQGRPDRLRRGAADRGARAARRQRDDGGGGQCAREREGVTVAGRLFGVGLGPGDPELADRQGGPGYRRVPGRRLFRQDRAARQCPHDRGPLDLHDLRGDRARLSADHGDPVRSSRIPVGPVGILRGCDARGSRSGCAAGSTSRCSPRAIRCSMDRSCTFSSG